MKLLIVRHAVAMERDDYQKRFREKAKRERTSTKAAFSQPLVANDDFRPLTAEGISKMKRAAKGLGRIVEKPVLLATSPLTRALQTAEILCESAWKGVDSRVCEALRPEAPPAELVKWLLGQAEMERAGEDTIVALVGHEPHLSTLIAWLTAGTPAAFTELKKGGACLVDFKGLPDRAKGRIRWLETPSILRSLT